MKFDSMTSHDITYVGIIQTARASGMKEFPLPYVMTNCHNSLCAVGGTINEDDHQFALSAAHKYGGIYVPPNMAVIHSYNREMMSGCGRMILGSDSHTRYGALGHHGRRRGRRRAGQAAGGPHLRYGLPRRGRHLSDRQAQPRRRPPRRRAGAGGRHLRQRLCEKQGHGVCRPRRCQSDRRLPQRHRRHDHRDHLLVLHLADRRCDETILRAAQPPGGLQRAETCRCSLLRRLHRAGSVHH